MRVRRLPPAEPTYSARGHDRLVIQHLLERPLGGVFSDPGTGKTGQTLAAFHVLRRKRLIDRMLVVAPVNPLVDSWPGELQKWGFPYEMTVLHGARKDRLLAETDSDVYGVSYDGLAWLTGRADALLSKAERWWLVLDECFIAGTLVSTQGGRVPIESLRVGDSVVGSDGRRHPIKNVFRGRSSRLVTLSLSDGTRVVCTPRHPIFTDLGWMQARLCAGRYVYGIEELRMLRRGVLCLPFEQEEVLRAILRSEGEMDGSGTQTQVVGVYASICTREAEAVLAREGDPGARQEEDIEHHEVSRPRSRIEGPRWERHGAHRAGNAWPSAGRPLGDGIPDHVGPEAARLSYVLQSGLGGSVEDGRDRGGRGFTQGGGREVEGREEVARALRTRVDSVEGAELGSPVDVYDIEVDGPRPHYFAGGILVHNSHKIKRTDTQRFRALKPMLPRFARRTVLTGTPRPNRLEDLFGQAYAVDLGAALGRYITHFRREFFFPGGFGGYDWIPQPGAEARVYERLGGAFVRVDESVLDLPPLNSVPVRVELPPEARRIYRELEREFVVEMGGNLVVAVSKGVASGKLRQLCNGFLYDRAHVAIDVHSAKVDALEDLIEGLDGPLLVGYEFEADAARLSKRLGGAPAVGDYTPAKRRGLFADFNAGRIPVLLAQSGSVSLGVNLQEACHHVAFFSLTWKLDDYIQFRKRVHRAGQTRPVTAHHIIARDTVEDRVVWPTLSRKNARQEDFFKALRRVYL